MILPMYFFQDKMLLPIWGSLMASQFVGALIFYWIDRRIFEGGVRRKLKECPCEENYKENYDG